MAAGGTQKVSSPSSLTSSAIGAKRVAVVLFNFSNDSSQVASTTSTSFTDATIGRSTTHTYYMVAYDAAGNSSAGSNPVSVTP